MKIGSHHIGIAEYGDPAGTPVLYFHGFPGSRVEGKMFRFDEAGKDCQVRIIGIDRPGMGDSDFQHTRRLTDWPGLVLLIADALHLKKFSVLGISGGGPYALSCAYALPERLHSATVISGMGPFSYKESMKGNAMLVPRQIGITRRLMAWGFKAGATKDPGKLKANILKSLPLSDVEYLSQPGKMEDLIETFRESFKQGIKGYLQDAGVYRRSWGFRPADIKARVILWHGTADQNVSIEVARRMASEIPGCITRFIEDEGHFSLTAKYLKEVLHQMFDISNSN